MTTPKNGGAAFPHWQNTPNEDIKHSGMSLRDWFAGQALTGLILNQRDFDFNDAKDAVATLSYRIADSMLKERQRDVND